MFFANGASFANWLPRIDEVRDSIGVGNGGLGLALLGGGLGGILGSIVGGRVLRAGLILRVLRWSMTGLALTLPLIAFVPNAATLLVLLTVLGFSDVLADASMNAEAAAIQSTMTNSIMHRIHAMWSLGFVTGTVIGWTSSVLDIPLKAQLITVSIVLLVVSTRSVSALDAAHIPSPTVTESSRSVGVSRAVFAIVFFALAAAAFEVTPNEWSATALRDWLDAGRLKGAGPVVFSAAMLIGRLRGDRVIDRIGEARLLALSLGSIAVGYVVLIVAPNALVALVAFALWGLGVSVMFPQIYLMAARMNPEHPGAGLAAMTLAQRIGFMTATSSMGALSAGVGYGWAFTTIFGVAALLWVAALTLSSPSSRDTHGAHQ